MTLGQLIVNILLISLVPIAVLVVYWRERSTVRRGLAAGTAAAALVVVALVAANRNLTISTRTMVLAVVITEEAAKLLAIAVLLRWQSRRSDGTTNREAARHGQATTVGWSVGAGFAAAEHMLYAAVAPRIILIRIFTAGILHLATGRLYGGALAPGLTVGTPYSTRRRRSSASSGSRFRRQNPGSRTVIIASAVVAGVLLHLSYNLLASRLDQIPVLW